MWEDIQALAGWAGLLAVVIMGAVVERMRRYFATKEDLTRETENRKIADQHIDERAMAHAQTLHNYMGRIDLLRDQMHEHDRARERELAKLREEVRTGFATMRAMLEREGN